MNGNAWLKVVQIVTRLLHNCPCNDAKTVESWSTFIDWALILTKLRHIPMVIFTIAQ